MPFRACTITAIFSGCFILLSACSTAQDKKFSETRKRAIELNDQAINLYMEKPGDPVTLKSSISLLKQSIKTDSSYYLAYGNISNFYCELGLIDSAIIILDSFLKINTADFKGKLFRATYIDHRDGIEAARPIYIELFAEANRLISQDTTDTTYWLDRLFLTGLLHGTEAFLKEWEMLEKRFPNDTFLKEYKDPDFDRDEYIKSLCGNAVEN